MKRTPNFGLLCLLTLVLATSGLSTSARAQEHQHNQTDSTRAMPMEHGGMMDHMQAMIPQMMRMHERMMADSTMHRMMMADPEMQAMMHEMMGGDHGMAAMRARVAAMSPDERQAHMQQMRAQMMERMEAMPADERQAKMQRMMEAHRRMMADPEIRERMMADPEMRQMMERMREGGMMDHGSMEGMGHGDMDHSQMEGMDHSQMSGMDHAEGVAMQRRNAGAHHGDERPATPTVGQAEFDASATADRFHAALSTGDRAAVEALLEPDAVVLEGGNHESRAEYLSHHFARDAEYLSGTTPEPLFRRTTVAGDAAWVASTQRIGDAEMAELLVMKQTPAGWRVAAVHWSSAR